MATVRATATSTATGNAGAEASLTPAPTLTATPPSLPARSAAPPGAPQVVATAPRTLTLQPALGGRRFERPTEVGAYPGGRMYVAEQAGTIEVFAADGTAHGVLLDVRSQVSRAGNE